MGHDGVSGEGGRQVAKGIEADGGTAMFVSCDVSSSDSAEALAATVEGEWGGVDGVSAKRNFSQQRVAAKDSPFDTAVRDTLEEGFQLSPFSGMSLSAGKQRTETFDLTSASLGASQVETLGLSQAYGSGPTAGTMSFSRKVTESYGTTEDSPFTASELLERSSENAFALGGTAPHAGLFATVDDVATVAQSLLNAAQGRPNPLGLPARVVRAFWEAPPVGTATWALAWDRPAPSGSQGGTRWSRQAVGHLGFTGCSVWIDRTHELVIGEHQYGVRAIVAGAPLPAVSCFVSHCPGVSVRATVDYTRRPPAARITWGALPYPVRRVGISRRGAVLNDNLPPDTFEYWDSTLTPGHGEVRYELMLEPIAGNPCGPISSNRVVMPRVEEPYLEPIGGWDYVYDPDAHDPQSNPMDRYVAQKGVEGCLDGSWIRSVGSDYWDGSAPGEYTLPGDPVLIAPGGVEIRGRPGEGLFGQSIKTLSIEDPGNPVAGGYPDPSNRKIVLGRVLAPPANPAGGRYAQGVTVYIRWRLTPDPRDVADAPVGTAVRDSSHGMFTLCYHDGDPSANDPAVGSRSFGMALVGDMLDVSDGGDIYGLNPGEWVSVWYMTEDADRNGAYHSRIYLNGDPAPIRPDWRTPPENADRWEERLFADTTIPFTCLLYTSPSPRDRTRSRMPSSA